MPLIILCLDRAGISARLRVIALGLAKGKVFVSYIGVVSVGIERGINSTTKSNGAGVSRNATWRSYFVIACLGESACLRYIKTNMQLAVRACNHNMKIASVLTVIFCLTRRNRGSPKSAFVIRSTWGVGATRAIRVNARIALDI